MDEAEWKELIRKKTLNIDNLESRRLFKKIVAEGPFMDLVKGSLEAYKELEDKVINELPYIHTKCAIYTTICNKSDYVQDNGFLSPMIPGDKNDLAYNIDWIKQTIEHSGKFVLFDVFMECEGEIIQQMIDEQANRNYRAEIVTDKNKTYTTSVELSPSIKYLKPIEQIYELFQFNNVDWKTVNNPYVYKFVDVAIKELPSFKPNENIKSVTVHLDAYDQYKKADMMLLWNIQSITVSKNAYPVPLHDQSLFEHHFSLSELGVDHGYLVDPANSKIVAVRYEVDELVITTNIVKMPRWNLVKFRMPVDTDMSWLKYQVVSNRRRDSFAERFAAMQTCLPARTKGEFMRIINSFYTADEIKLTKIDLVSKDTVGKTIDVNYFIVDELRDRQLNEVVRLIFETDNPTFITVEQMSFLVSELQQRYPEYRWVGELA